VSLRKIVASASELLASLSKILASASKLSASARATLTAPRGHDSQGDFAFVQGSRANPTGPHFDVICEPFVFELPAFIY
jgi:hypothetical protein